jgi:HEPN domain-containing protein
MSAPYSDEARRWLLFARADLEAGRHNVASGRFHHVACFHAQQAAEKCLKTVLVWSGVDPPRIHDLDELRDLIPDGWAVREAFPDLAALSFWAVHGRYPGEWLDISTDEAASLVEMADSLFAQVLEDLGSRGFEWGEAL